MTEQLFRFWTDIEKTGRCDDTSDNNIIYFGNYVLYRPNYRRNKFGAGYNYSDAVLIDLSKSYIDIPKFFTLFKANNINIMKQQHILNTIYNPYSKNNDYRWIENLKEASKSNYLEISNTSAYYLSRIQYTSKHNILLITHKTYSTPRSYTLINTESLTIIDSGFGNNKAQYYIKTMHLDFDYDCIYKYVYHVSPFDADDYFNISDNWKTCDLDEITVSVTLLKNRLPVSKYSSICTGSHKGPGLLFIENGLSDTNWNINNFKINTLIEMLDTYIPDDIKYIIHKYALYDLYIYLFQHKKIIMLIYCTSIYHLQQNLLPGTDNVNLSYILNIPNTFKEFYTLIKNI